MTGRTSDPHDAIDWLFESYVDDVYRYALYSLHDKSDAEDVVQEVFLRALRSWEGLADRSHPKAWLLQITRNYLRDLMRRQRIRREHREHATPDYVGTHEPAVDRQLDLEEALDQLKPAFREVLTLRFLYDLSIEETAVAL